MIPQRDVIQVEAPRVYYREALLRTLSKEYSFVRLPITRTWGSEAGIHTGLRKHLILIRVQVIFQSLNPRMMINGCHQLPNNAIHLQSTYTDDFLPNTTCNFLNSRNRIAKSTSKPLQENPNSKETCNRLLAILPTRAVMFSWTPGHG